MSAYTSWRQQLFATYRRVPRASAQAHPIVAHPKAADPVLVAIKTADSIASKYVPDLKDEFSIPCTVSYQPPELLAERRGRSA